MIFRTKSVQMVSKILLDRTTLELPKFCTVDTCLLFIYPNKLKPKVIVYRWLLCHFDLEETTEMWFDRGLKNMVLIYTSN